MTTINYKDILAEEKSKWEKENGIMSKKQYCSLYSKIRNKYDEEFRMKNVIRARENYTKNKEEKNEQNKLRAKNNRAQYNVYQKKYYYAVRKPRHELEKQQAISA